LKSLKHFLAIPTKDTRYNSFLFYFQRSVNDEDFSVYKGPGTDGHTASNLRIKVRLRKLVRFLRLVRLMKLGKLVRLMKLMKLVRLVRLMRLMKLVRLVSVMGLLRKVTWVRLVRLVILVTFERLVRSVRLVSSWRLTNCEVSKGWVDWESGEKNESGDIGTIFCEINVIVESCEIFEVDEIFEIG
jgi:hypothetical protein